MSSPDPDPCKFCDKKGFPILPMRVGAAATKSIYPPHAKIGKKSPDAVKLLGLADTYDKAPLDADTVYTGRVVRKGYLFVYYEDHDQWDAYTIDNQAHLSWCPLPKEKPPKGERFAHHDACARNAQKSSNATLLVIPDPETAGAIWIGYSDVFWTRPVRDRMAKALKGDDKANKSTMTRVDVTGIYKQQKASYPKHAWPVDMVDHLVADYALAEPDRSNAFYLTPSFFKAGADTQAIKQAAKDLWDGPAPMVVLNDPVGVTTEVASIMHYAWKSFTGSFARKLEVDASLTQLEMGIKRQAEERIFKAAHELHKDIVNLSGGGRPVPNTALLLSSYRKKAQPILDETVTAEQLQQARTKAWAPYEEVIDHTARQSFRDTFHAAAQGSEGKPGFNRTHLEPLAKAHAAWMASPHMQAVFDTHFDAQDINSGVAFSALFAGCVVGTTAFGACKKQYQAWLDAGVASNTLLWRALTFNNADIAGKLAAVTGPYTAAKEASWKALFTEADTLADKLDHAGKDKHEALMVQAQIPLQVTELGALLVEALKKHDAVGQNVLAALGLYAGQAIGQVQVHGTVMDTYGAVYKNLLTLQPNAARSNAADRTTALDHRQRVFRAQLIAQGKDPDAQQNWAGLAFVTVGTSDSIVGKSGFLWSKLGKSVEVGEFNERLIKAVGSKSFLSPVAAVMGLFAVYEASKANDEALKNFDSRAGWTLAAAWTGLTSGLFDAAKLSVKSETLRGSRFIGSAVRAAPKWLAGFAEVGGAITGAVSGWILAGVDYANLIEANKDNESGLAMLYKLRIAAETTGGIVGIAALLVEGAAAEILGGPVIWVITVIIISLTIIIEMMKDSPALIWTKSCDFGVDPTYGDGEVDFDKELKDYLVVVN